MPPLSQGSRSLPMLDDGPSTALPNDADQTGQLSRRHFLKLMGAALALAGGACTSAPREKIVPYVRAPEQIAPGTPLFYATAVPVGGYAEGVLVESHEGRPTKIEGNPDHPASLGATGVFAQASVLSLYDPDRSRVVISAGRVRTWDAFLIELRRALARQADSQGAGLRLLTETITSPTLAVQFQELLVRFPRAAWYQHDPLARENVRAGATLAFGQPAETRFRFDRADVVLGLDADALDWAPGHVRYRRDVGQRRRPEAGLSRIYAVESSPSILGSVADHRLPLRSQQIEGYVRALAVALGIDVGADRGRLPEGVPRGWLDAVAADLREHRGRSVVVVGEAQPPTVHAIAHAVNAALENVGTTLEYTSPVAVPPPGSPGLLSRLVDEMRAGSVEMLVILGGNPAYSAPADIGFAEALSQVTFSAHLGLYQDETAARSQWHVPEVHPLEAWGDVRAYDGTASIVQPLIAPLYGGHSAHELLAALSDSPERSGHDVVRGAWGARQPTGDFDRFWQQSLHDGVIAGTTLPSLTVALRPDWAASPTTSPDIAGGARPNPAPSQEGQGRGADLEVVFRPDPTIHDGRYANNTWLQELPKPITMLTWENAITLGPATAERLGLTDGDVAELRYAGRTIAGPVMVVPGQAEASVGVTLGYGRQRAAGAATGAGYNAYAVRTAADPWIGSGASLAKTGQRQSLAITKDHHTMEGRDIARSATLSEYDAGAPPASASSEHATGALFPARAYPGYAWGMAIDLGACLGCQACVVACQAENNIPVVGKEQVLRGREMHWLRIDAYLEGTGADQLPVPGARRIHQPVPCMHCENAPCELVCPVEATVHSSEGLNDMVYNRCLGTRYCSNNCPYKVRRFNFLEFADFETESLKSQRNPNVTVRSRGVMEKCTYCVQRITSARIAAEKENRPIRDGEILTACQAVCPTDAIVFGNVNDPTSRVSKLKASDRDYALLAELGTRPRTTYLKAIRNPNPALGPD
jgi:molybdopterin-containing oxidoreductase family iron-sulfur binding subunit